MKSNLELYRGVWVVTGGYRRLPERSVHFSWHTDRHCIIIYISSHHNHKGFHHSLCSRWRHNHSSSLLDFSKSLHFLQSPLLGLLKTLNFDNHHQLLNLWRVWTFYNNHFLTFWRVFSSCNHHCLAFQRVWTFTIITFWPFTESWIPGLVLVMSSFFTFWIEYDATPARSERLDLEKSFEFLLTTLYWKLGLWQYGSFGKPTKINDATLARWKRLNVHGKPKRIKTSIRRVMLGVTTMLNFFTTSNK